MKKITGKEIASYVKAQFAEFNAELKYAKGKPVNEAAKKLWKTTVGKALCGAVALVGVGIVIGAAASAGGTAKSVKMVYVPNEMFYIQQTEVTKALYKKVMGSDPGKKVLQPEVGDIPAVNMNFKDAVEFCNRLSEKAGYEKAYEISGGKIIWNREASGYRLPTVDEWLAAAQDNDDFKYSGSENLDEVAWFGDSTIDKKTKVVRNKKWEQRNTLPESVLSSAQRVGKKNANSYGLYDMSGNVEELCWKDKKDGYEAVRCGGSFHKKESNFELNKTVLPFDGNVFYVGFRVARNLDNSDIEKVLNMTKIPERNISMGATEVTQGVYEKLMGVNPAAKKGHQLPVESISWLDAIEFCNKLSDMCNLQPAYIVMDKENVTWDKEANGYRLPTEAEWEFCSKGGMDFKFSGSDDIDEVAWYGKNSNGTIHKVGRKKANAYGLYDMTGNVWEWCWDPAFANDKSSCDKGGSFKNKAELCSTSAEDSTGKKSKYTNLGMRLVRGKISDIDINAGEEKLALKYKKERDLVMKDMVKIPGKNYLMLKTEVTQKLYERIIGKNPSKNNGPNNPVENINHPEAIDFCNRLSERTGLTPVYVRTDGSLKMDPDANGFRLPTMEEWQYCFKGGKNYKYSGSDNLDEVAWYERNSYGRTHPVGKKKANGYGLYDMSGNVSEWFWHMGLDIYYGGDFDSGGLFSSEKDCTIEDFVHWESNYIADPDDDPEFRKYQVHKRGNYVGFRIVCNAE